METRFNPLLVSFSLLVAIFASYVALNLANSVRRSKGTLRVLWISAGAIAMGTGIWSMHFVGMLALEMPDMQATYDLDLMIASVVVAIAASGLALSIVARADAGKTSVYPGGTAMAFAIAGMHYLGMYSMRMPAIIVWNYSLMGFSVLIALIASVAALKLLIHLRESADRQLKLISASMVMGFAIAGMHYTGMLAATFVHSDESSVAGDKGHLLMSDGLTLAVVTTTISILGLALAFSVWKRLWETRSRREALNIGQSEAKFRHLVEAVKDYAIMMLDLEGRVTTWNAGAKRLSGYSDEEIIGKHVSVFYTREDVEANTADQELRSAEDVGHWEGEGLRVRKDGSTYWANIVITPLLNADGAVTGFSKVVRDITSVKESAARMRAMNEDLEERVRARTLEIELREYQLRTVTNAVPVLIGQVGTDERVQFANETFNRWFAKDGKSTTGLTMAQLLGPDRYPSNSPHIKRALNGETVTYERISRSNTDLGEATMSITLVPEFSSGGTVTGLVIVAIDISRQKEIQAELEKAKEAAEVANSTKSAFLANMSHEIRTPLGAILGFSELLINETMSAGERAEAVEVIKRNGRLLSNVINDILDISKVEAGRLEIEKISVSFDEVMKDISSMMGLEAEKKGISLEIVTEGLIPNSIKTDPLRLKQILINIVGNAIKFTAKGLVEVRIRMLDSVSGPAQLAFIVKDTGAGIDAAHVQRLFMPFQQADASITRKFGGTGLGLVLSRKLATALGGDVRLLDSVPAKGSTFMITIDPEISQEVTKDYSARASIITPHASPRIPKLNGIKVLVVDDSPDNQMLIKAILRHSGAEVETASNGGEAVDKALTGDFAVILMDLQMPVMDGYEAAKNLRERGYKKPIVALTAHAMKEERDRTLANGFDDHITKPIDQRALIKTIAGYSV